jgi:hypothetical protein
MQGVRSRVKKASGLKEPQALSAVLDLDSALVILLTRDRLRTAD